MIRRILAALLRLLFGRRPAPPRPRTLSRDELERLVMDYRRELGKRAR